jgi:PAS domain S-box-containing protein
MLLNARLIPQPPAKPRIILLAIEDITERKRVEALRESEEKFRNLVENASIGIFREKIDGSVVLDANPKFCDMLGLTREEFVGQPSAIAWVNPERREEMVRLLRETGSVNNYEIDIRTKSGEIRTVIMSITAYPKLGYLEGGLQDITDRKQMEHKLNEAYQKIKTHTKELEMINENLDSFAYSVSHDLRAPLRAISGFAQVLKDTHGDKIDEEMRHYLNRISEGAQKMGQLIDDLLGFSRATRSEIKYETINVENIVNDLVKAYRDVEPDRAIEFIVNPLGEVEADKEMLKVVFSNLLQNAVKFTIDRKKARIEIGREQKEDHIQFLVKDNGIGFDMKYKDKLFKAFQRLQTDERFSGTGIGLTTVERIVSKHGGNIWANGEVDKGAEFYFTLPSKRHVDD